MGAETVKITLKVEKSKYKAFLEMLKLLEFVSVEPGPSKEDAAIVGYEADGRPIDAHELVESAKEALRDKMEGKLTQLRDFKI